ncbi:heterokaryon incompatibility protein-domain-containing protein, partial [Paraphoma chrysanthemicola]
SQPSVESLEQAFTHAPIDLQNNSIRLLEVLPADPNDPNSIIQCRLRHDTTTAVYTCLSYVWGPEDPLRKRMILINGKTFWVRHNLVKFLEIASQHFEEAVQSLWVDALCIDQLNLIEKSHQVQRMGMIYSNADHVIAWLGKDQKLRHWFPRVEMLFKDYLEISYNQEFIDGLRDLCHDDYWHRAWITQETILAQHICYLADDEALCPDTTLATVLDSVAAGDLNMSNWAQQMIYRRDHHRTLRRQGRKLMQNLADFISKDCLDPRDKIYSLLSISCDVADIAVDYNSPPIALAKTLSERLGLTCICKAASIKLIFKALGL